MYNRAIQPFSFFPACRALFAAPGAKRADRVRSLNWRSGVGKAADGLCRFGTDKKRGNWL
jgi:hypothetical protein